MEIKAKMKIRCSAHAAYEAFCDPEKITNFWFTKSSARWESGKTISLEDEDYAAAFDIEVILAEPDQIILFNWADGDDRRQCTLRFDEKDGCAIVEAVEAGWQEEKDNVAAMLRNQTGWVSMLTCLKAYLENGINTLRAGLVMD